LAANQVAAAHEDLAPLLPIGNPDPVRQKSVEFLWSRLQAHRIAPMDLLMERLRVHALDLTRVCGKFLQWNLTAILLRLLRRRIGIQPSADFRWRGEYLTPDNPIRLGPSQAEGTTVLIPKGASGKHHLQLQQYLNAFSPPKRRGRHPKPPGAPRTRQPRHADPLARQAAALKQQGLHWRAIAQALWPDQPPPTEYKARERLRKRVERLAHRGLLDALP
jgi:hypothetical protein